MPRVVKARDAKGGHARHRRPVALRQNRETGRAAARTPRDRRPIIATNPNGRRRTLRLKGESRQNSNTRELIYDVSTLISKCSNFYTLLPGDVIYTGTPAGVGPVQPGDILECEIEDIGRMQVQVSGPRS